MRCSTPKLIFTTFTTTQEQPTTFLAFPSESILHNWIPRAHIRSISNYYTRRDIAKFHKRKQNDPSIQMTFTLTDHGTIFIELKPKGIYNLNTNINKSRNKFEVLNNILQSITIICTSPH